MNESLPEQIRAIDREIDRLRDRRRQLNNQLKRSLTAPKIWFSAEEVANLIANYLRLNPHSSAKSLAYDANVSESYISYLLKRRTGSVGEFVAEAILLAMDMPYMLDQLKRVDRV